MANRSTSVAPAVAKAVNILSYLVIRPNDAKKFCVPTKNVPVCVASSVFLVCRGVQ